MNSPKPTNKRSKSQQERDRRNISSLYLQLKTQSEIAETVGVNQSTVSRTLKSLQKEWQSSSLMDFNEAKARELAKIDHLELVYWDAWERSKKAEETSTTKRVEGDITRTEAQIQKKDSVGDKKFLDGVQWCIDKRCKILGLDSPDEIDATLRVFDMNQWKDERQKRLNSVINMDVND